MTNWIMTDEHLPIVPLAARANHALRASDEDREQVVEVLSVAVSDGRLADDEFEGRLEAALTACTNGELAALTSDLTEAVAAGAKDVVRLDFDDAAAARRGRWIVPRRMEVRAVFGGSVTLDFTEAVITAPTLDIQAEVWGGRLVLLTGPGIEVDVDGVASRGGRVKVRPARGAEDPIRLLIKVSGEANGGEVVVRPRHRTFRRWASRTTGQMRVS